MNTKQKLKNCLVMISVAAIMLNVFLIYPASATTDIYVDPSTSTIYHDIVITDITPSKTVIGQGYNFTAHITIVNRGDYTENFTLFATCGFIRNLTLDSGTEITVDNMINTSNLPKGNYRLYALVPPCFDDCSPCDNIRIEGNFTVAMVGDITGPDGWPDGKVDMRDIGTIAKIFGVNYPDPRYDPNCDVVYDLKIDMKDIGTVAKHFGETNP